jgi:hypothetical protein
MRRNRTIRRDYRFAKTHFNNDAAKSNLSLRLSGLVNSATLSQARR